MTREDALASIGKPFKWTLCVKWDTIKEITDDDYIIGEFLTAPLVDCRLKQEQPEHLKKHKNESSIQKDQAIS